MTSGLTRAIAAATAAVSLMSSSARPKAVVSCDAGALVDERRAELTSRANHRDAHQAALDSAPWAKARIRSSSKTPSQRATTAVAMQLPMTLTAVRPMSMI